MSRYTAWLAVGIAGAFLVIVAAAFSLSAVTALAFAIAIGTLLVSSGLAVASRGSAVSVYTAGLIAVISAWTIVASLVFSQATVDNIALASSLAIVGFALVGLTTHEVEQERALRVLGHDVSDDMKNTGSRETRLASAA